MTSKELMDSLSDSLLRDERILSARERELLTSLLQGAKARLNEDNALTETIARSVGEVVMQRAYGLLGNIIVRRLQKQQLPPRSSRTNAGILFESLDMDSDRVDNGFPKSMQETPGPAPLPRGPFPPSPSPPSPGPPKGLQSATAVGISELPEMLPAQCVILEEFLAPAELDTLLQYVLERESDFQISEVVAPGATRGVIDFESRRSRVLIDLGKHEAIIVNRIQACWSRVLQRLEHDPFVASKVEAQITTSNDGDFFRCHSDNGQDENASREITFVYFFQREPKRFTGGELRIYDSRLKNGAYAPTESGRVIVPQQNQIVFFASPLAHEITPVRCPSQAFADSRFTVNGWFHR